MKFGKEFASQMVPEWQEAYMDYSFLKGVLKEILLFNNRHKPAASSWPDGLKRSLTLYRAFSGLTLTHRSTSPTTPDIENQVIVMHNVKRDGDEDERLETMFLNASDDGGEYELVYFKRLDDEFNKVLRFYKGKVVEVMKEAAVLNKQMNALVAFRVKVENPNGWDGNFDQETDQLASDVAASRLAMLSKTPSVVRARRRGGHHMDVINEEGSVSMDESRDDGNGIEMKMEAASLDVEKNKQVDVIKGVRPAPLEILKKVKFNTAEETPRSTIKGFLKISKQNDLTYNKDSLNKAEEQLKRAFVEFYQKLRLLKNYSFLNIMAFSKIMKKYDKITSRHASRPYMKMVDNSYLGSSDEVSKLMERVEVTFIKHFSNANRSKGMNVLRPKKKREKHRISFSMGFAFGCTVALIIALVLVVRAQHILDKPGRKVYMETLFPLYSLFGYVVLHMLMFAGNIYFWRKYRVNYSFIFGFKEGTELGYGEVLLCGFCLSALALANVLANLDMEMDPITQDYKSVTELLPLGLVMFVVVIMLCPFNLFYRSCRYFLLVCLFHCILSPLYKVTLPDFFLADQLTSQVPALRNLEFYVCYYGWGDYKKRGTDCKDHGVYVTFSFIIAAIPYMWRLLQCLRRLYDEKDAMQGYNGLKYFSTIVAVCARMAYVRNNNKGLAWQMIALITSIIATVISMYWDIILDWGLLQRSSKNRWLRDKLLVPYKSVYFIAIVLNVLLRLAWMQSMFSTSILTLHKQTTIALVASLEIIRRGIWNFFRLENEHLNNVGKFRAFKSVPLPFNYDEDDEDKDE